MQIRTQVQSIATNTIVFNRFVGVVEVAPRVGKTKITIDALNTVEKEISVLILAPRKEIFESWKEEMEKWNLRDNIKVEFLWSNSISKNKKAYNLIIADEIHAYNLKVLGLLAKEQLKGTRILALTGTLDGDTEFLLETMLKLNVLYTYSVEQAIADKIIADYEIICVGCDLDAADKYVLGGNKDNPFLQTELEAYTYWDKSYTQSKQRQQWSSLRFLMSKRLDVIYNARSKQKVTEDILSLVDRCIIFSGRQDIADKLGDNSFHSKSDKDSLKQFSEGKIDKLSVVSMVSMGVTIPDLKVAVFNQLKSGENLAVQQAMRAMNMEKGRKATIYIVYLRNTQDEVWMRSALKGFESSKIKECTIEELRNGSKVKSRKTKKSKSVA
jgi:superfamily II DNA or RNA helicase